MMSTRLFRNGTVILHGQDDRIDAKPHTDVLVEGTKIVGIGRSIQAPAHAEIIDCTNKIISPGFVDTRKFAICKVVEAHPLITEL